MAPALASTEDTSKTFKQLYELLEAHDRFPALFDEQRIGMVLFDLSGSLVRANRAARESLGAGIEELAGFRYLAFVHESDRDRGRTFFARAAGGERVDASTRVSTVECDWVDVPIEFCPAIVDGTVVGVYCAAKFVAEPPTRKLQELTSLFSDTADAAIAFDAAGRCVDANAASEALTGYDPATLRGRHYLSLFAVDARDSAREVFSRVLAGESVSADTAFEARGNRRVEVSGTSVPIFVDGIVVGAYTIARDVTADRALEAALREQTVRMRELYTMAASVDDSVEGQIGAAIKLGCRRLRCDAGYVTRGDDCAVTYLYGIGDHRRAPGSTEPLEGSLHEQAISRGEAFSGEIGSGSGRRSFVGTPIDVNGERIGALFLARSNDGADFSDADRDFVGLLGTLISSTLERDERRRRAELLAFHDPLTGLANRTLLADRMEHAIASAERHRSSFAVHFFDLDNFKTINDQRGHLRGDDVLRSIARRFESVARTEDTVARIGGDEFVILQPGIGSRADVETLANRLRGALAEPFVIGGAEYRVTASAGIAVFPSDAKDAATLIAHADAALYRVKNNGRDGIAFYSERS